ncbi:MAG: tRNA glutamyl-Q(34) synthetase GluQRS [Bacteroidaceae bacterium]|nr:tRNA glutamyl-Q(34) synthetase GluQRS [Bacteroidaceae bacterium]
MTGRFAPSPTGRMHLGNVFCALLSWLSAKSQSGEWRLRIEDLDPQRSRRDYALQLQEDLQWLGLPWDGEVVWQSERSDIYEHYLQLLKDAGLTYPCFCTRADIMATQAPHESDGRIVYAGTCREKYKNSSPLGEVGRGLPPAAIRLIVPDEVISFQDGHYGEQHVNLAEHCGDYILRRKDGAWAYQLAVVVDDALMGVTEVVRGRDLLLSTPQQIHLHRILASLSSPPKEGRGVSLGFPEPCFCHHPLLVNEKGQRLCKRDLSMDLGVLREKHVSPEEIIGRLAHLAGIIPEPIPALPQDLLPLFTWQKIPQQDIMVKWS